MTCRCPVGVQVVIPARKSGWIEIVKFVLIPAQYDSRSQERVDRNTLVQAWIQMENSRSQERVDRNILGLNPWMSNAFPLARAGG